jgi:predicted GNAT family acetyltransferase
MIFTTYSSTATFADEVTDILMRHEIQNNLLFLNIRGGIARDDTSGIFMATVKDDNGHILLTAIGTSPNPTLLYETDNMPNDDALELFTASLVESKINIDLIMSETELAKRFCESYSKLSGKSSNKIESLVLYIMESVNCTDLPAGNFRKAAEIDMHYLPYWLADFIPACHLGAYDLNIGTSNAKRFIGEGNAYVLEDGIPVTTAAYVRQTSCCGFIGYVYTPPQYRGRGYCTACVSHLSQSILDSGKKYCALYADRANPYSNKVYQKLGYKDYFYYDKYALI